jgi:hypothetical protein
MEEWRYGSAILDLRTRQTRAASFTLWPLYSWEKHPVPIVWEGGWALEGVWRL